MNIALPLRIHPARWDYRLCCRCLPPYFAPLATVTLRSHLRALRPT
jgi:hypothetical protein